MISRPLAAALLLVAVQGRAELASVTLPPDKPLARPIPYRVAYQPYPSGMRLVVHEGAQAPRVTMNISYRYRVGATLRFRTTASVVSRLMDLAPMGRSLRYWEEYPEHLAAVTPDAMQALVKQLSLGREVVVIAGDAASLKPQLTAAGFKPEVLAPAASAPMAHAP